MLALLQVFWEKKKKPTQNGTKQKLHCVFTFLDFIMSRF